MQVCRKTHLKIPQNLLNLQFKMSPRAQAAIMFEEVQQVIIHMDEVRMLRLLMWMALSTSIRS